MSEQTTSRRPDPSRRVSDLGLSVPVLAALVVGCLLIPIPCLAQQPREAQETQETQASGATQEAGGTQESREEAQARDFTEPLPIKIRISLEGGKTEQKLQVAVHRWDAASSIDALDPENLEDPENRVVRGSPQSFTISITSAPPFIDNARFVEGTEIEFGPGETRKTVTLQFNVAPAAPVREGDLVLVVRARDSDIVPAERELTIPFDYEEAPVLADPSVEVCAIGPDAPANFPHEDAIGFCRPQWEPTEYDRVAVFFTPPRDFREPYDERDPFFWRILGPNGDQLISGSFDPKQEGGPVLATDGSPGPFVAVVDLWRSYDQVDPAAARRGPGTYTLQSQAGDYGPTEVFGQGEEAAVVARIGEDEEGEPKYAEHEDFETFDVSSMRLHFQGFVVEDVKDVWLPDREDIWEGKLTILDPEVAGSTVTWGAEAEIWKARWEDDERKPEEDPHRPSTQATIEFPEEMTPGHEEMGDIHSVIQPGGESEEYLFTAGMHLLIPTTKLPPDRHLVEQGAIPSPWANEGAIPEDFCNLFWTGDERFTFRDYTGDGGVWVWQRTPLQFGCDKSEAAELDVVTTLLPGGKEQLAGDPRLHMLTHLHERKTKWVIPVFITLTDEERIRDSSRTLEMKTYGYAIYGAEPGTYDGPGPTGSPPVGDGPDESPEGEDPDPDDPGPDPDDPEVDPDDPMGDPPGGDPGEGDPGEGEEEGEGDDPGPIDPSNPDVAGLIREWLNVAEPVQNADGASFRYDQWGRLIGSSAPGQGETRPGTQPPPDGGGDPVAYTWGRRGVLDSIDHCLLEEYVVARLENTSIAHCAGRYVRTVGVPRVVDLPVEDAASEIRQQGLEIRPTLLGPAPSRELAHRVAEQRPSSTERLPPGGAVEIDVYGDYEEPMVVVPDLVGLSPVDAQRELRDVGLELQPRLLGAAPTPEMSERVADQDPEADELAPPGSDVEVSFYSAYEEPMVVVPDLVGLSPASAQRELRDAGLEMRPRLLGAARTPEMSERVAEQTPSAGEEASPGSTIEIGIYGAYVPPEADSPDVDVREGLPDVQCPPVFDGRPLDRERSGHRPGGTDLYFTCSYPGTVWQVQWVREYHQWYRWVCTTQDGVPERAARNYYRIFGRVGHVVVNTTLDDGVDREWQLGVARSLLEAFEPYALPCPGATERIDDPDVTVPSLVGLTAGEAQNRLTSLGLTLQPRLLGAATRADLAGRVASQYPAAGASVAAGSSVTIDIHGDYIPPVQDDPPPLRDDPPGGRPFWVVVGFYMPFDANNAEATVQADISNIEDLFSSALSDPSAWSRAAPIVFGFSGAGLNAYSARQFQTGDRWAAEVTMNGTNSEGEPLTAGGAFLVRVEGVYHDWDSVVAAVEPQEEGSADREAVMPFDRSDGRTDKVYPGDRPMRIAGGPLQRGWSAESMRSGVELILDFISFIQLGDMECFLATAVYETGRSPELMKLRLFRDEVLKRSSGGRALVDAYYKSGPKMAAWVDSHPETRMLLRPVIDRLAGVSGTVAENPTLSWVARIALSTMGPSLERITPEFTQSDYARLYLPWTEETVLFRAMRNR